MRIPELAFLGIISITVTLTSCGPTESELRATIAAELTVQATSATSTITPSATSTQTPTSTNTAVPTRRPTKKPTATPAPGAFDNPLGLGYTKRVIIPAPAGGDFVMDATLLEVARGQEAQRLAKSNLSWLYYEEPIEGQEYVAVRLRLQALTEYVDLDKVWSLYPHWSVTLRRDENSSDIWSLYETEKWAYGYPPFEGEGWRFFLVRQGASYFLYFHPNLAVTEEVGNRTGGAFFALPDA